MRNLFYSNPIDFFTKEIVKLHLVQVFNSSFQKELRQYAEIIARRNIYTYNLGIVERKHLRDVKDFSHKLDTILPIDD